MKKKIKALLLLGLVFLGGCGQASAPSVSSAGTDSQSIDLFAMDTAMTLTAYGDHAGEALEAAKFALVRATADPDAALPDEAEVEAVVRRIVG